MGDKTLIHARQQMLMQRPWDAAEPESFWEITGVYPNDGGTFTQCIAVTLPQHVTGSEDPVFMFVGALSLVDKPLPAAWITHARPLLLVHRDEPTQPYWEQDRVWLADTTQEETK